MMTKYLPQCDITKLGIVIIKYQWCFLARNNVLPQQTSCKISHVCYLFMQSEDVQKLKCDKILFICPGISCILITVTPICQILIVSNPVAKSLLKSQLLKQLKIQIK